MNWSKVMKWFFVSVAVAVLVACGGSSDNENSNNNTQVQISNFDNEGALANLQFTDSRHGWVTSLVHRNDFTTNLHKTEDGDSWNLINDEMPACAYSTLRFVSDTKGYCLHLDGVAQSYKMDLIATSDGGETWSTLLKSYIEYTGNQIDESLKILGMASNATYTVVMVEMEPQLFELWYLSNETNTFVKKVQGISHSNAWGDMYIKDNNDVVIGIRSISHDPEPYKEVITLYEYASDQWSYFETKSILGDSIMAGSLLLGRTIDFVSNDIGYMNLPTDGSRMILLKTVDGGKTWSKAFDNQVDDENVYFISIDFADETHGVTATPAAITIPPLYYTEDGGETWSKPMRDDGMSYYISYSAASIPSSHIVYVSGFGEIYKMSIQE